MSRTGLGFLALMALMGAALCWQIRTNRILYAEIGSLRAALELAGRGSPRERTGTPAPVGAPERPDGSPALARLREEIGSLQRDMKKVTSARTEAGDAIPVQLIPAQAWKNAGRATPSAAMETFFWAALAGELETLAAAVVFPEEDQATVQAWFASLPESVRQQYASPERLLGLLIAKDAGPLTGMRELAQRPLGDTDVVMKTRFSTSDGDIDDSDYLFRRTSDGWRLVVPADAIGHFARHLQADK